MDVTKLLGGLLSGLRGGHRSDAETLSAYVDGRLAAGERAALDAHLPTCAACTTQLAELRRIRSMLAAMPQTEAPRSFRLRVADVEAAPPAPSRGIFTYAPTVAAAAMFLFVLVGAADLATRGGGEGSDDASSATSLGAQRIESDAAAEAPDKAFNYSATPSEAASGAIAPEDGQSATADAAATPPATGAVAAPSLEQTTRSGDDADTAATAPAPQPARDDEFTATVRDGEADDDRTAFRVAEFTLIAVVIVALLGAGAAWFRRRKVIS